MHVHCGIDVDAEDVAGQQHDLSVMHCNSILQLNIWADADGGRCKPGLDVPSAPLCVAGLRKDRADSVARRLDDHAGVGADGGLEDVSDMAGKRCVRGDRLVREPAAVADHVGHENCARLKGRLLNHILGASAYPAPSWRAIIQGRGESGQGRIGSKRQRLRRLMLPDRASARHSYGEGAVQA